MAVDDAHDDYTAFLPRWHLADDMAEERNLASHIHDLDLLGGAKSTGKKNEQFKARASFFGATGFTESGLVGIALERDPVLEIPPAMDYLLDNVDGTGQSLNNQLQGNLRELLRKGRVGLFVTFPKVEGGVSVADQEAGNAVATIHAIEAQRVINWWTIRRGAKTALGGVVFMDVMETRDGFDVEKEDILRSLTLEDGVFVDRKWREGDKAEWVVFEEHVPLMGNGVPWSEIPFIFAGATDNTPDVDPAPLYSLARKNADHLNNSAINEEGIWFSGHIQPVGDEMNPAVLDTIRSATDGGGFAIGSGELLLVKGFRFEVAEPNTAARQAMLDKIEDMKAIGARILQPGGVAKTAQQDSGEQRVQHSVLSLAVENLEDAMGKAIAWACVYMGVPEGAISMDKAFMQPTMTAELIGRIMELYDRALVGTAEVHKALTRANIVDDKKTEDEYSEEVAARAGDVELTDADA